jgi:hypothetical protein
MKILAASVTVLAFCAIVVLAMTNASAASVAPLQDPAWGSATAIFVDIGATVGKPDLAQDSAGNVHAIWYFTQATDPTTGIMYATRDPDGVWSAPVILPPAGGAAIMDPTLLVNIDDRVHVLWTAHNPDTYTVHTYKLPGEDWETPEVLAYGREAVDARIGPDGTLHLTDKFSNTHLWLPLDGDWSEEPVPINVRDFEIDSENTIHAIGSLASGGEDPLLAYSYQEFGGDWETTTYGAATYPELAVDPDDGVHVAWLEYIEYPCQPSVCYRYDLLYARAAAGSLLSSMLVDSLGVEGIAPFQLGAAGGGVAHLMWSDIPLPEESFPATIRYAEILGDGSWGLTDSRLGSAGNMAVAWNGDVHLVWRDIALKHQWREAGSPWSAIYEPNNGGFDITWAQGVELAPGHEDAPNSLHALHLLFMAPNTAVYNDFAVGNIPGLPSANFIASPTSGTAPLLVAFDNQSTGDFDTCLWDFGDTDTSSICGDPTHTYLATGTYTVTLTVSGIGGTDTLTRPNYITVSEPTVDAQFTAAPTSGIGPLLVTFTNESTGDFATCVWAFGDGGSSNDCNNPSHTYAWPGSFDVTLVVTGVGGTDANTKTDYITVYFGVYLPLVLGNG